MGIRLRNEIFLNQIQKFEKVPRGVRVELTIPSYSRKELLVIFIKPHTLTSHSTK